MKKIKQMANPSKSKKKHRREGDEEEKEKEEKENEGEEEETNLLPNINDEITSQVRAITCLLECLRAIERGHLILPSVIALVAPKVLIISL